MQSRLSCRAAQALAAIFLLPLLPQAISQTAKPRTVTIHNDLPRRDVTGAIVDAHDGNLQFFHGRYYLYGTAYGKTAGFSINNRFRVYSSPDLMHWTFEGELLKPAEDGVYYRPYVVYNAHTRKYVLWFNWYPKLWEGKVGVATSDTPVGPFQVVNSDVQLSQAANHPGDGSLFVDEDQRAYFIYTVIGLDHSVLVERLTDDYLASTGEASAEIAKGCEAPTIFRNQAAYYALFDATCCFCANGSGARVYKATSPLGPYTLLANINRDDADSPIVHAQQTYVARLPTPGGTTFLWMADRWGSRPDHVKGHDFQYWAPLHIADDGSMQKLKFEQNWTITILSDASPHARIVHPFAWPQKNDPHPLTRDACSHAPLTPEEGGFISEKQLPPSLKESR